LVLLLEFITIHGHMNVILSLLYTNLCESTQFSQNVTMIWYDDIFIKCNWVDTRWQ